jgi:leucyl aminopeptidase
VVLVGKGITFDAGGLNPKPGNSMEEMKATWPGRPPFWAR